jgi:hypothetical protein
MVVGNWHEWPETAIGRCSAQEEEEAECREEKMKK